ncbi:dihydrolipoamide dehydrogenase [Elstera litoralis]|uniref:Dihydrolipoyl dehydrogenase n=1 Tax=Elstera litoralis TaxID=552518 RepID=A0A0F3IWN5_9PROT|nr:dihydrolipoyl dehydrogenase [Elstera litoralis]KJV11150.1 dihydrolipoamide dehydrogenase [Elstera litoralis]
MADNNFDVVFVGGGPGGYIGAIRAAQLGLKTACIDKRGAFGGTCLNVGCIPSKALLKSSEYFHLAQHGLSDHGFSVGEVKLDLPKMMARKDKVVGDTVKGIDFLFKKNKVTPFKGAATITGPNTVKVVLNDGGEEVLTAKNIIIATGSDVVALPGLTIDEQVIVSSTGALALGAVPKHLVVIGGGVIGLELGSVWQRLGAKVTVVEFLDRLIPGMDGEIAKNVQRVLAKQGMDFKLGKKVVKGEKGKAGVTLTLEPAAGGAAETLDADVVLVAIGRRPYTDNLGLDKVGVALDPKGRVVVDHHYKSSVPSIFAIGDVITGPMLAHKAEEEGVAIAELLAGQAGHVNYDVIPSVIYTSPEVASVGKTEEELKAAGIDYKVGKVPFSVNARARANGDIEGFVKILTDARTDKVLGCHIIHADAGTLIAEAALAMEFGASAEDIARTCHAHPTVSEVIKEAGLAANGRTLNM